MKECRASSHLSTPWSTAACGLLPPVAYCCPWSTAARGLLPPVDCSGHNERPVVYCRLWTAQATLNREAVTPKSVQGLQHDIPGAPQLWSAPSRPNCKLGQHPNTLGPGAACALTAAQVDTHVLLFLQSPSRVRKVVAQRKSIKRTRYPAQKPFLQIALTKYFVFKRNNH